MYRMRDVRRSVYRLRTLNLFTVWGHGRPGHSAGSLVLAALARRQPRRREGFEPQDREIRRHASPVSARPPHPFLSSLLLVEGHAGGPHRPSVRARGLRANAYTKRARRGCRTWPRPWLGRLIFIVVSVRGYLGGSWWR
jgi:hypothetical protein